MSEDSARQNVEASQEDAEELLEDAVDAIAKVQDNYGGLTQAESDMLGDGKASIASVYMHLGADGPVMNLDL